MSLKRVLKKISGRSRKNPRPALNDLDLKLSRYLDYRNGFFIECGANDGYSQSNTYFLEKKLGWRGVLIEAMPELFERCRESRTRSVVYNCALVSREFRNPTVTMHYANLMSLVDGARKTQEEQARHLSAGVQVQHLEGSYAVDVPARTLDSILDEIQVPEVIDFFSLDVEGYELNVLRGLNLSRYRPVHLLVEADFFEEVDSFLSEQAYEMIEKLTCHDYLYKARRAPA